MSEFITRAVSKNRQTVATVRRRFDFGRDIAAWLPQRAAQILPVQTAVGVSGARE